MNLRKKKMLSNKRVPRPCKRGESIIKPSQAKILFKKRSLDFDVSPIKLNSYDRKKGVILPTRLTPLLAEEMGMHLGDGFLSARRKEYRLKGHKIDEAEYYLTYVKNLYKTLYNVDVNIKKYFDTIGFELSSLAIWKFKVNILGIQPGRKDKIRVPEVVKVEDKNILASFLRGFFDTDGSVAFLVKYGIKSYYPCISAAQKSPGFIEDIAELLRMFGFFPRVHHYRDSSRIVINGFSQLRHFERQIGWSSTKHLKKVARWKKMFSVTMV